MIHLSSLLLLLQYCFLFIISLFSFLRFIYLFLLHYYFIFIIYLFLSSPPRSSWVNVVLIINNSLIFFAPSSLIQFPVHYILLVVCYSYYCYFLVILLFKSNEVHGVMGNTFSMYFISSPNITFHFIVIS